MLRTRFTDMFGLAYPVMSAPMALHSGGTLAAAVSAVGGLGCFGGTHPWKGPDWIRSEIEIIRAATDRPFAVGFITPFLPFTEPLFEATIEARPAVIALSFADPRPWLVRAKDAGARVMCQVQNYNDAEMAVAAGTDVLVAQGNEAGGHTGTWGLLPFLAGLVRRYPDVPVLAAGGIGDGRTLAAALVAGADGAWLGTAFLATPEAVEVHDVHKRLIVESDGGDTVWTRAYDIVSGLPWPTAIGERVRRNRFTNEWSERESALRDHAEEHRSAENAEPFAAPPEPDTSEIMYGQSAVFVDSIRPAAEVVCAISGEAETILDSRPRALLGRPTP
ncbi:NAD(P)H-dependent flavin oxidoreductase [Actinopolymorpha singaporensis]|uniref:Nitronate monooxygenase n=1 Tax=Actinopolymorpha singaporensis TaxID=117157 RepID=A0A1H1Q4S7_9ACTN|nr:nitronate monooxygenase [Actinopolymorpha singaporensis]SDS18521.1 nitronate monooxygenase [Actinopolymorpha singaporensis]